MASYKELLAKLTDDELAELENQLRGSLTDLGAAQFSIEKDAVLAQDRLYSDIADIDLDVLDLIADREEMRAVA